MGDVTPALFKQLTSKDLATSWYSKTNIMLLRTAAHEYIILWCKAISEDKCDEFTNAFKETFDADVASAGAADDATSGDAADADDSRGEAASGEEEARTLPSRPQRVSN